MARSGYLLDDLLVGGGFELVGGSVAPFGAEVIDVGGQGLADAQTVVSEQGH
jgi:hypothetical protein